MSNNNLFTIIPSNKKLYRLDRASYGYAYYINHRVNLISGIVEYYSIEYWYKSLDFKISDLKNEKRVIHIFYELGFITEGISDKIPLDTLLAIDIQYTEIYEYNIDNILSRIELDSKYEISPSEYKNKFNQGYRELLEGNCYQFNLTFPFIYKFSKKYQPLDFVNKLWSNVHNRGAFGNATYSKILKKLLLSNSPECLFDLKNNKLKTMPIKGTLKLSKNISLKDQWTRLINDKKNESELFMITDLLLNDLSRIELPDAKVECLKKLLIVPGLLHQYSEISVNLSSGVKFKKVIDSLFPGGSITGAPKKNSMRIIQKLESRNRGFYCGSTILLLQENLKASINIRSAEICFKSYTLNYSSGGGITLKSRSFDEYNEMINKKNSFISLFS